MKHRTQLALAASILTAVHATPCAIAQSNEPPSETSEDYADDPSYQAARRLLEVFAASADNRATEEQRAEDEEELSSDPWPDAPDIGEWDHHYFIFQGENYFPIIDAYVTPYVTLFSLEYGYTPMGEENKDCGNAKDGQKVEDGAKEVRSASESALVGDAAGAQADTRRYGCPNTLGQLWGSGSQVMDKDHNPLAEQWFPDGTKAIVARDFPLHDEDRYEGDDPTDFVVVFSGGPDRLSDPAIQPLRTPRMIVVDYPVLRRDTEEGGGLEEDDENRKKPYIPNTPELPITVFGRPLFEDEDENSLEDAGYSPIDAISERIEETLDQLLVERAREAKFLLVHRGDPNLSEQIAADRLRTIRETLNPYGDVEIVSFGQEMPICRTSDERCWSMNRSSILYIIQDE
ncbi:MAG: hypothetical protein AAF996_03645 [Pseudomonadota bacterium]